jgi:peptidoglycan-associated lipoprotein
VDSSRIRTVSYGKERPVCDADTEECWQQNRRAHFVITA